jgi:hypothetical protein
MRDWPHTFACRQGGPAIGIQFETAFSSLRAWSIWSYADVTMAAVVLVSPLRESDA